MPKLKCNKDPLYYPRIYESIPRLLWHGVCCAGTALRNDRLHERPNREVRAGQTGGLACGRQRRRSDGPSDCLSRQTPVFIDQFDPATPNQTRPSFSVANPTNGPGALWINGNASTEGGMARSADRTVLTLSGYCGDILSKRGTPSKLAYDRGIAVVGADGSPHLACLGTNWYGLTDGKTNPRDAVSDGMNNFWGCGSAMGTLFYNAKSGVTPLKSVSSTRAVKIINNTLYFTIMTSDGEGGAVPGPEGGIYDFVGIVPEPGPAAQGRQCGDPPGGSRSPRLSVMWRGSTSTRKGTSPIWLTFSTASKNM